MATPYSEKRQSAAMGTASKSNSAELERRIQDLETMAGWRDELAERIQRAKLCFGFVGIDPEDQDRLNYEVETFRRVCTLLAESGSVAP